ncbi:hypothetical protein J6590_017531 [Homalodisca vitripennis]|nr:hypothetical protein J6590_017531 [Homalodisca vitripennis]
MCPHFARLRQPELITGRMWCSAACDTEHAVTVNRTVLVPVVFIAPSENCANNHIIKGGGGVEKDMKVKTECRVNQSPMKVNPDQQEEKKKGQNCLRVSDDHDLIQAIGESQVGDLPQLPFGAERHPRREDEPKTSRFPSLYTAVPRRASYLSFRISFGIVTNRLANILISICFPRSIRFFVTF